MCPFSLHKIRTIQRSPQNERVKVKTYLCPLFYALNPSKLTARDHQTSPNLDFENIFFSFHFASNIGHSIKLQTGRVRQNKNPLRDLQLFKGFMVCFFCRISSFHASPCLTGFQPCTFSNGGAVVVAISFLDNMLEGKNRVLNTWFGASLDRLSMTNKQKTSCFFRIHIFLLRLFFDEWMHWVILSKKIQ